VDPEKRVQLARKKERKKKGSPGRSRRTNGGGGDKSSQKAIKTEQGGKPNSFGSETGESAPLGGIGAQTKRDPSENATPDNRADLIFLHTTTTKITKTGDDRRGERRRKEKPLKILDPKSVVAGCPRIGHYLLFWGTPKDGLGKKKKGLFTKVGKVKVEGWKKKCGKNKGYFETGPPRRSWWKKSKKTRLSEKTSLNTAIEKRGGGIRIRSKKSKGKGGGGGGNELA